MPSTRKLKTKDGRVFYEISVSRGRSKSRLTRRWYPPEGWSRKAIERELAAVAAEFERQSDAGEVISRSEQKDREAQVAAEAAKILTLRQYGERVFMPSKTITMSENSRANYQSYLDKKIYPALGDLKLPEITPAQITALLLSIQAEGKAHSTVIKVYTILHSFFKMAYQGDMIDRNPMDKVERPKPRKDEIKTNDSMAYTPAEVQKIFASLEEESLKWRTLVHLLIDTGIRRGECCALQWKNIDFSTGTIAIRGNLCYTQAKGIYLDTPKNSHIRTVYAGEHTLGLLRQLRVEQSQKCISSYVFTQESSPEPMHPQSPTRYLKKFSKRYGIPDLHPHKLRHTFASIAIINGADIASVSEALGHSDKAVTLRMYTHADQESISQAAQIVRRAIEQAGQG
ncbi:site-specific integrase [Pseudoflavonifractor capillosus]|uniref:tyrosine-type recombinase/integrase n=1 Tax=Pseudoflavonifractor capillosus TaxID=106588 RepID=UPI0019598861|nr:site-specific integrase [Pseudoflavonifractor capillosus]MBM6897765.1 site-specific integrase [Pseudoflavonifractor capillosus]